MRHSKEKVNRSGRLLAEEMRLAAEGKPSEGHGHTALEEAIEVVEWWRGEHARPLSEVAASVSSYVAEEGAPVVTQRLKKLPTIASKLLREPKMKLARMADIGGVRAVVHSQASAFRIAECLRQDHRPCANTSWLSESSSQRGTSISQQILRYSTAYRNWLGKL